MRLGKEDESIEMLDKVTRFLFYLYLPKAGILTFYIMNCNTDTLCHILYVLVCSGLYIQGKKLFLYFIWNITIQYNTVKIKQYIQIYAQTTV